MHLSKDGIQYQYDTLTSITCETVHYIYTN